MSTAVSESAGATVQGEGAEKDALYKQVGRLTLKLDWLNNKLVCSTGQRRDFAD